MKALILVLTVPLCAGPHTTVASHYRSSVIRRPIGAVAMKEKAKLKAHLRRPRVGIEQQGKGVKGGEGGIVTIQLIGLSCCPLTLLKLQTCALCCNTLPNENALESILVKIGPTY